MKPYPEYKDSGVEWIGEIPDNWKSFMIKRLTKVKRGASPRPIDDLKYFDECGNFAWVRIADVSASDRYLTETKQTLSELGASLSVKRYPGDLFLSIAGSVGKPIITKIKCCIHDGFVWFPDLKMNPEYLYYIFSTGLPYQGLGKWGTQLNLNTDTVGEIYVPIPSQEEIELILQYLDHKTAQIDSLIEKKKRLIELLREERTAVINQAVTKGLDPYVPMKDSGIEWLGEIPAHWEVKSLKWVMSIKNGEGIKSDDIKPKGEFPVYGGNGIAGYTDKYNHVGSVIVIGRVGAKCGNVHLVNDKIWISDNALIISTTNNVTYISLLLKALNLNTLANQNAQPLITGTMIKEKIVPVPTQEEQELIVKFIFSETKRIDTIISKSEKEIELLQEYRTALISEVVTGKIDVREERI